MFTIIKALLYGLAALAILAFVLANQAMVPVSLTLIPDFEAPLYAPVTIGFGLGLMLGLLYAARAAIAHKLALRRARRQP